MTANHPLSGLLRLAIIVIAVPWAILMSGAIMLACAAAQMASFLASCFIFVVKWRWPKDDNVVGAVACPRVVALWREVGALWPTKAPAH